MPFNDEPFFSELQETFLAEAIEIVETLEVHFIELEKNPDSKVVIEKIFRLAHTLKGSAKAVAFDELSNFTHIIENLLVKLKDGDLVADRVVIGVLLEASDLLNDFVRSLQHDRTASVVTSDLCERLITLSQTKSHPKTPERLAKPRSNQDTIKPDKILSFEAKSFQTSSSDFPEPSANLSNDKQIDKNRPKPESRSIDTIDTIYSQTDGFGFFEEQDPATERKFAPLAPDPTVLGHPNARRLIQHPSTESPSLPVKNTKEAGVEKTSQSDETIRISLKKIDYILDYFGEQLILQAGIQEALLDSQSNQDKINHMMRQLHKVTYDLQKSATSLRSVAVKGLFQRMNRVCRDTAEALGKQVQLNTIGGDLELDKTFVDNLGGPLTHIIRNAVDHGIESIEKRRLLRKRDIAQINLEARQESGFFILTISDDGHGIDSAKVREKAVASGLISENHSLSEQEMIDLLFRSGFSTADQVSDVSGRGVGMDAVKRAVEDMRGTISVRSKLNHGTVCTIKLPLSMSIFNGILFTLKSQNFVLPSLEILEVFCVNSDEIRQLDNERRVIQRSEHVIPLIDFASYIGQKPQHDQSDKNRRVALMIQKLGTKIALEVDEVIGQRRIVQKKLGREAEGLKNVAGGAIMGDGSVALILSTANLGNDTFKYANTKSKVGFKKTT